MDEVAFLKLGCPAKISTPHAAASIKTVGKAALYPFAPRQQKSLVRTGADPVSVPMHSISGRRIPMSALPDFCILSFVGSHDSIFSQCGASNITGTIQFLG